MPTQQSTDMYVTHEEFRQFDAKVASGFETLTGSIKRIEDKLDRTSAPKGVNWGWITSGILLLGGFIALYVNPISEMLKLHMNDSSKEFARIHENEVGQAYWQGMVEERLGISERKR